MSFVLALLVLALTAGPFPGAVILLPPLAATALYLSFARQHWLNLATWLVILATPWLAPSSLRLEGFFPPALAGLLVAAALGAYGCVRGRGK